MKILVVGTGGREHALARRLQESDSVGSVTVFPGNPGIGREGRCAVRGGALTVADAKDAAMELASDLVVIGPAEPLAEGLADQLRSGGFTVVGPPRAAAAVGASKTVAKELMIRYGIPTPAYRSCDDPDSALAAMEEFETPILVKADGLAAGTGVTICHSRESAEIAIDGALRQRRFGKAGERVIIEQHLPGKSISLTVLVDDSSHLILPTAMDHTEIGEGGVGPNTLGMGALAPNPLVTPEVLSRIESTIVEPSITAVRDLSRESGIGYRGVLHFVLILTDSGPQLLGYKIRFGDPETQAILALVDGDFGVLLEGLAKGRLSEAVSESGYAVRRGAACAVVAAVSGYPGPFAAGQAIHDRACSAGVGRVYFGMVKEQVARGESRGGSRLLVSGGRVLTVAAWGETVLDARRGAYARLLQISFEGMIYRRDIGGMPVITTVIEEDTVFLPQFEKRGGLVPVVVQDVESGNVLMVAYADSEAVRVTRETGLATFRSTSRDTLWTKGKTSGNTLTVEEIRVDCDQDALLYRVRMAGAGVCHTKDTGGKHRRRCFYRTLLSDDTLTFDE